MAEPKLQERKPFTVLGVYQRLDPRTADWQDIWANKFGARRAEIEPFATDDSVYGVYIESGEPGLDDFWAGMAVEGVEQAPEGLSLRRIGGCLEAVFECTIPTLGATWGHIHQEWLPASEYRHGCHEAGFERFPPGCDQAGTPMTVHVPIVKR
jgi:predicted transcriptional regulator YdeE